MMPRTFVSIVALSCSIVGGTHFAQAQESRLSLQAGETARMGAKYIVRARRCNEPGAEIEVFRVSQRAAASGKFDFDVFSDYITKAVRVENDIMPQECNRTFFENERKWFYEERDELYKML